jgi:redox-sensitive bicupin YhaK (pirin superfamily)
MITLNRGSERSRVKRGKHDILMTFCPRENTPPTDEVGILMALNELRIPPGGVSAPHPPEEAEIVTYVYKGTLAQEDSTGKSGVVSAGEFQLMTIGRGIRQKEKNASRSDWAQIFRIYLRPTEVGLVSTQEQKRFATAQRHNLLCVVASPDGRRDSLRLLQDALVFSSVFDTGRHLIHELLPGRKAWLHVIQGEATLNDIVLTQGDSAGFKTEPSVSLTARENTEILLVDLGPAPRFFEPTTDSCQL